MTPEQQQQQQVNAALAYFERQCANLAREGAQMAATAEGLAIRLQAAQDELAALKPKPESNVVPITEPAA